MFSEKNAFLVFSDACQLIACGERSKENLSDFYNLVLYASRVFCASNEMMRLDSLEEFANVLFSRMIDLIVKYNYAQYYIEKPMFYLLAPCVGLKHEFIKRHMKKARLESLSKTMIHSNVLNYKVGIPLNVDIEKLCARLCKVDKIFMATEWPIIQLHYLEGYTFKKITEILSKDVNLRAGEGALKERARKGISKIRRFYKKSIS